MALKAPQRCNAKPVFEKKLSVQKSIKRDISIN
jgi:hypothetical protein